MTPLDIHTVIKELVQAGMPEKQAEIIVFTQAQLIDERLATNLSFSLPITSFTDLQGLRPL